MGTTHEEVTTHAELLDGLGECPGVKITRDNVTVTVTRREPDQHHSSLVVKVDDYPVSPRTARRVLRHVDLFDLAEIDVCLMKWADGAFRFPKGSTLSFYQRTKGNTLPSFFHYKYFDVVVKVRNEA